MIALRTGVTGTGVFVTVLVEVKVAVFTPVFVKVAVGV